MATRKATIDFILEQAAGAGSVSARKMFGEYGLYCDGRFVALVCHDQLYIKPTEAGRAFAGQLPEEAPYPGAKPHPMINGERLEDADWLAKLLRITAAAVLPPKPKSAAKPKPKPRRSPEQSKKKRPG